MGVGGGGGGREEGESNGLWLLLLDLLPDLVVIFVLVDDIAFPVGEAFIAAAAVKRTEVGEKDVEGQWEEEEEKDGGKKEDEVVYESGTGEGNATAAAGMVDK